MKIHMVNTLKDHAGIRKGSDMIPRPEYPRPQFERDEWVNLNGAWTFTLDQAETGMERRIFKSHGFDSRIIVPFCPESRLSGVEHKEFIRCMWYHRKLRIPAAWKDRRVRLNFGGVDYESEIFIDGEPAGRHFGGTVSFSHDITDFVKAGSEHDLFVYVRDDTRSGIQPAGKQSNAFSSYGCMYTRTTGIWQTVWMEPVSAFGLRDVHIVPDLDNSRFVVTPRFLSSRSGLQFCAELRDGKNVVAAADATASPGVSLILTCDSPKPWSPESPFLYDLILTVRDESGAFIDSVKSYAGLRKVHTEGNRVFINNKPTYLRLVLDQGFYPDGIWTAPNDAALKRDIELSMKAGFNGARLHQKVFEERFHYWADKMGYLTWGETSSWGCDPNLELAARNMLSEWAEIVMRDRNHPSIIAWTPWNETADTRNARIHGRMHADAYELAHMLDPTRPVNDASGYVHVRTDLWTIHHYEQDPGNLHKALAVTKNKGVFRNFPDREAPYQGQPYLVDEFGGIKWIPPQKRAWASDSWGYGDAPKTLPEFYKRLEGQVDAILAHKHICGYCYTQLTDVEQEQNGIYNYDRTTKFDMKKIAAAFGHNPEWWK